MAAPSAHTAAVLADEVLVQRLREGDREAFELLYERYFHRIFNFVGKRLRHREDTEETVQEVFINLFSSIHGYRGDAPFGAWVFGLTRRTIAGRFKRKRRDTLPLPDEDGEFNVGLDGGSGPHPDPLLAYEANERLARLDAAMSEELTAEQRQLFLLHHLHDQSIAEIATRVEKSEDAVKSHLDRARTALLAR